MEGGEARALFQEEDGLIPLFAYVMAFISLTGLT